MIEFASYTDFKNFILQNSDRRDLNIAHVDLNDYVRVYVGIGNVFTGVRNILKNTLEYQEYLNDDWSKYVVVNLYTEQVWNRSHYVIPYRGAGVDMDMRVRVLGENMIIDRDVVGVLEYGMSPNGFLQIFRAGENNIADIRLVLRGEGNVIVKENFDNYVNDADLRAVWIPSDTVNTNVYIDGTIYYGASGKSMRIDCRKNGSPGDTITKTFIAENWSGYEAVRLRWRNQIAGTCVWRFRISSDGVNWAYSDLVATQTNVWEEKILNFSAMTNISAVNLASITRMQFYMVSCTSNFHNIWVDQIELLGGVGNVKVKLYDFGDNPNPNQLGSLMVFDNGSNESIVPLSNVKKILTVYGSYGFDDVTRSLTKGNYYGIYLGDITSGKCYVFGSNITKYNSGKLYSVNGTNLSVINGNMGFGVMTAVDGFILNKQIVLDNDGGDSAVYGLVVNKENGLLVKYVGDFEAGSNLYQNIDMSYQLGLIHVNRENAYLLKWIDAENSQTTKIMLSGKYVTRKVNRYN